MQHILRSIFLLTLALGIASPISAATFRAGDFVTITSPVADDIYIAGGNVSVEQDVTGDIIAAGGQININGTVTGDIAAAGGNLTIAGQVRDDVRVAGGSVSIRGPVGRDVIVMGGNVTIEESATVGGDIVLLGGNLTIASSVGKSLIANGGNLLVRGTINGPFSIQVDRAEINGTINGPAKIIARDLILGDSASFRNNIDYWTAKGTIDFGGKIQGGQRVVFHPEYAQQRAKAGTKTAAPLAGVLSLYSILSSALLILFIYLLTRTFFIDAAKYLYHRPWWSLLWGFLFLVLTPIAALILFITVIGIPLGLFLIALYIFSIIFMTAIAAVVISRWAETYYKRRWSPVLSYFVSIAILILLQLITLVPIAGWIVKFVIVLIAFGAYLATKYERTRRIL